MFPEPQQCRGGNWGPSGEQVGGSGVGKASLQKLEEDSFERLRGVCVCERESRGDLRIQHHPYRPCVIVVLDKLLSHSVPQFPCL